MWALGVSEKIIFSVWHHISGWISSKCALIQSLCSRGCFWYLDILLAADILSHMAASVGCYSPAYSPAGFSKHIVRGSHQSCTVKYSVPPSKSERVTLKLQLQTHDTGSKDSLTMKLYHSVLYIVQQINVNLQQNYMLSFSALYAKSWRFTVGFTFKLPCNTW